MRAATCLARSLFDTGSLTGKRNLCQVPSPPFSVALRLTLEVAMEHRGSGELEDLMSWRARARIVARREPTSRSLPADVVPSGADATAILNATFAEHPMVNTGRRLDRDGISAPRV